jgi:hypothetical protein
MFSPEKTVPAGPGTICFLVFRWRQYKEKASLRPAGKRPLTFIPLNSGGKTGRKECGAVNAG